MSPSTRRALKEWAAVIAALRDGRQVILLRKGGIHEPHGRLQADGGELVFFPSYEHQQRAQLQPAEAERYRQCFVAAGEEGPVAIDTAAQLVDVIELREASRAFRLAGHHVWTEDFVRTRVEYKPERPLLVLILRAFTLPRPAVLPRHERYAGCRSWVDLEEEVGLADVKAVLSDADFELQRQAVRGLLER